MKNRLFIRRKILQFLSSHRIHMSATGQCSIPASYLLSSKDTTMQHIINTIHHICIATRQCNICNVCLNIYIQSQSNILTFICHYYTKIKPQLFQLKTEKDEEVILSSESPIFRKHLYLFFNLEDRCSKLKAKRHDMNLNRVELIKRFTKLTPKLVWDFFFFKMNRHFINEYL